MKRYMFALLLLGGCDGAATDTPCEGPTDRCLYDGGTATIAQASSVINAPPRAKPQFPYPVVPRWYNDACLNEQMWCEEDLNVQTLCDPAVVFIAGPGVCNTATDYCGEEYLSCISGWGDGHIAAQ